MLHDTGLQGLRKTRYLGWDLHYIVLSILGDKLADIIPVITSELLEKFQWQRTRT